MRNIKLIIAYDGTNYVGWQVQPNGPSVQGAIQEAIRHVTGETSPVLAAGRTDSGVHALGQVANFRTESSISAEQFRAALQHFLPKDIVVRESVEVPLEFHATYSSTRKRYRYLIHNAPVSLPVLRNFVYWVSAPLDVPTMVEAGRVLVGTNDFRSFESHFPNKASSVRTVMEVTVQRQPVWQAWSRFACPSFSGQPPVDARGDVPSRNSQTNLSPDPKDGDLGDDGEFIAIDVMADGFLYNMVRAIAGTLLKVGQGKWTAEDVRRILESQDRSQAGPTAPAHGLYLVHVDYYEE